MTFADRSMSVLSSKNKHAIGNDDGEQEDQ